MSYDSKLDNYGNVCTGLTSSLDSTLFSFSCRLEMALVLDLIANIITPRACTRGKVIGSVVIIVVVIIVSTKIARSRAVGILASGQCSQNVITGEKVTGLCF